MLFACRTATDMACSIFPKEIREDEEKKMRKISSLFKILWTSLESVSHGKS
jgi:hypothetical protein